MSGSGVVGREEAGEVVVGVAAVAAGAAEARSAVWLPSMAKHERTIFIKDVLYVLVFIRPPPAGP